ncbi:bip1 [Drosophila busckii]|uniref:Bip1 n=2 Tax=Drosophila busckii TaxID=30019 RepID=A0A0M3QW24_DROBS|nr:bip1 [Drosophila busckii]
MSSLRICKAMSLHPAANIRSLKEEAEDEEEEEEEQQPSSSSTSKRICLMGCEASAEELRRFPIHDINRCNYWLQHFGVSEQRVQQLGGVKKLRICFRHFSQRKEMAKTRFKTTPLRAAKVNIATTTTPGAAAAATTTATVAATIKPMADSTTTIELVESSTGQQLGKREKLLTSFSPVPQRSHSICSSGSSSDVQSISSDYEASLPLATLVDGHNNASNGLAKKRKLYLITEKSDEKQTAQKKRKMIVVVEQEQDKVATKKLMIVTDKPQANLTQHLEKFLPELLSCIQDKELAKAKQESKQIPPKPTPTPTALQKTPITLPPKKNPTNFIKLEQSTNFTLPASVSVMPVEQQHQLGGVKESVTPPTLETETNINLSPDFRFLMKILPKLEQLPEPHKQNVKRSIQIFVEKSYSIYGNKD